MSLVLAVAALSFGPLFVGSSLGAEGALPSVHADLVRTTWTSEFSPPSPDPSGLAYLPSSDTLLISDGEVNEMPDLFTGDNLFFTRLSGSLESTGTTLPFSDEPTGAAINPSNNHLFFSDDAGNPEVFEVDVGPDGRIGGSDDTVSRLSTSEFGSDDPEGIAFDVWRGHLYVVDGAGEEVFEIEPGANGVFDGVPPSGDDLVRHFDTSVMGLVDPEGIEFDPDNGHLYVLSSRDELIGETTTSGTLLRLIDISSTNAQKPAGLAYAPSSSNQAERHLYIVDRGVDNNSDPKENDGRLYEIAFPLLPPDGGPTPTISPVPSSTPTPTGSPTFIDVPFDHPYHDEIEALYEAGYTAGCSTDPLMYCPDETMNRAESAVFVERGVHGVDVVPEEPTEQIFADVPLGVWITKWVTVLWEDGYTAGCGSGQLLYCPWQGHTRAEGSVFYLRMLRGPDYIPPDPSGIFDDVPLEAWYAKWVEEAYSAGILSACGESPLQACPEDPLTRGLAARMMVQAKGLPVP